jgi:DNA-binding GntR family transcriptional regulator
MGERGASKAAAVLRLIRGDIVAGRLKPGAKLSFRLLKAKYQTGLSPIREALFQLAGAGLVVLEAQRGFRVASVSPDELAHIAAIRLHLELFALGLAIERGGERWRRRLQDAGRLFARVAAKAGDQRPIDGRWERIHREYHFALIDAWSSPAMQQLCEQLYDKFDRYRRLTIPVQAYMAVPARDHTDITAAALSGQTEKAKALLKRHIDDIVDVMVAEMPRRFDELPS